MKVLFVCKRNVGRSQMAEAFFNYHSKGHLASSAGYAAEKYSNKVLGEEMGADVVRCMQEKNIGLTGKRPIQLTQELSDGFDMVVWMDLYEAHTNYIDKDELSYWGIKDPKGKDYAGHCEVRDEIEGLVKKLIAGIDSKLIAGIDSKLI